MRKVVFITGGASGLGKHLSLSFANRDDSILNNLNNVDISKEASPLELFNDFFKSQHDRDLILDEQKYLESLINNLEE